MTDITTSNLSAITTSTSALIAALDPLLHSATILLSTNPAASSKPPPTTSPALSNFEDSYNAFMSTVRAIRTELVRLKADLLRNPTSALNEEIALLRQDIASKNAAISKYVTLVRRWKSTLTALESRNKSVLNRSFRDEEFLFSEQASTPSRSGTANEGKAVKGKENGTVKKGAETTGTGGVEKMEVDGEDEQKETTEQSTTTPTSTHPKSQKSPPRDWSQPVPLDLSTFSQQDDLDDAPWSKEKKTKAGLSRVDSVVGSKDPAAFLSSASDIDQLGLMDMEGLVRTPGMASSTGNATDMVSGLAADVAMLSGLVGSTSATGVTVGEAGSDDSTTGGSGVGDIGSSILDGTGLLSFPSFAAFTTTDGQPVANDAFRTLMDQLSGGLGGTGSGIAG
ncbi:hypothetical protein HK102_003460, partial [Quaeritorhiza haematococci]